MKGEYTIGDIREIILGKFRGYRIGDIVYSRFECEHFVIEEEIKILKFENGMYYGGALRIFDRLCANSFFREKNVDRIQVVTHGGITTGFTLDDQMYRTAKYL